MTPNDIFDFLFLKVVYSLVCGGIIGFERAHRSKTAGIKTNILICLGSMVYTTIAILLCNTNKSDPSRIIGQIITGIGFLGAGSILRPTPETVAGLTTAAIAWTVAALGILIGLGYGLMAVALALIIVSTTTAISWIEIKLGK